MKVNQEKLLGSNLQMILSTSQSPWLGKKIESYGGMTTVASLPSRMHTTISRIYNKTLALPLSTLKYGNNFRSLNYLSNSSRSYWKFATTVSQPWKIFIGAILAWILVVLSITLLQNPWNICSYISVLLEQFGLDPSSPNALIISIFILYLSDLLMAPGQRNQPTRIKEILHNIHFHLVVNI